MTGYQTAQYVAGPTRNNVPQQQAKAVVASAPYNANQTYPAQTTYQQNPQANAQPKRMLKNQCAPKISMLWYHRLYL